MRQIEREVKTLTDTYVGVEMWYYYLPIEIFCYYGQMNSMQHDQLYPVVREVVKHLECAGLQVHTLTCDKASPNRKFFRLHQTNPGELTYKMVNPYSADQRYIFFLTSPI